MLPAGAAAGTSATPLEDLRLTEEQVSEYTTSLRTASSEWATAEAGTVTLIVAAYDAGEASKAQADYTCDGVNDHVEIQAALKAVPAGGTVLLTEGTFNCAGNLQPGAYTTLKGSGDGVTVLKFPGVGGPRVRSSYVTFADFTILGTADLLVAQSHARVHNVTMTVDNSRIGAFYVWASNKVVEDVEFVNCKAIDCGRYGFINSGEGSPKLVKNVRFINCEAINCGRDSYVNTGPWVTGFDIVEKNDIDGAWIVGCYAEGNQESGFHLEGFSYLSIKNVNFKDCVSVNNAAKGKDACMFGAGFTTPKGCSLENCYSYNNKHGFLVSGGSISKCYDISMKNCRDDASWYGFMFRHGYDSSITDCISNDAERQGIVLSKAWDLTVDNFTMKNAGGYPLHAGSSTVTAAKFAGTKTADDPFAGGMWHGPVTDSTIDINAEGCASDTVICLENAERVTVTGSIASSSPDAVKVIGGSNVDTSGVVVSNAGDTLEWKPIAIPLID
ncbi:right-handed parallel beta-helix repeat-containing protein [Methanoculleus taiwanensis]|uniref:right-handed parallel beta-helix repeat-containing protein n=1 Tax=Methanoculleus taiwanensis TaxID=1550565 RepID=UPI001F4F3EAD|nr:right-handed parallel beta-helix repeat-containing protein [Methanoculleus taiwanensis]